jgi:trans-aconitate methyltransferase
MKTHEEYWVEQGLTYKDNFEKFPPREREYYQQQEKFVLDMLEMVRPPKSILEVGCGFGRYTRLLYDKFKPDTYDAIDVSPKQVAHTQALCPEVQVWSSSIQVWADVMEESHTKYDLIFAGEVLLHIPPEEIEEVIAKLLSLTAKSFVHVDAYPPMAGQLHYPYPTRTGCISVSRSRWTYVHPYPAIYRILRVDRYYEIIPPHNRQTVFVVDI